MKCLSVGRDYVTLKWVEPEFDGGAKIVGYIVERRERQNIQWLRCNFSNVSECHYTVSGLEQGGEYLFRVYVKNAAGSPSTFCEIEDFVRCEDSSLPPSVD